MTPEEYTEWFKGELIDQLVESDRFQQFVRINYDISKGHDEEAKSISLQIMEVPHAVAQERIAAAAKEATEEDAIQVVGADVLAKLSKT